MSTPMLNSADLIVRGRMCSPGDPVALCFTGPLAMALKVVGPVAMNVSMQTSLPVTRISRGLTSARGPMGQTGGKRSMLAGEWAKAHDATCTMVHVSLVCVRIHAAASTSVWLPTVESGLESQQRGMAARESVSAWDILDWRSKHADAKS